MPLTTKSIRPKTLIIIALATIWLVTSFVTVRRSVKGSNDFDTFYGAGRAILTGEGLYFQDQSYHDNEKKSPFLYPPAAAFFFAPFAILPLPAAAFVWNTLNLFLFAACLWFILTFFSSKPIIKDFYALPTFDRILIAATILGFLFDNISMAQVNILVFFLIMLGLVVWRRGNKDFGAGLILSLAVLLKVTPALFFLYFLIKRKWKLLGGMICGGILLTLVVPSFILGFETNRINHRQWLGRSIKPIFIMLTSSVHPETSPDVHRSAEVIRNNRLTSNLSQKNQSLEASLTRLFLKDRNAYALSTGFPIYAAQRYLKLPVIAGGLPREILTAVIRFLQSVMLIWLVFLWSPRNKDQNQSRIIGEISTVILSMTLFSPLARSHQFVSWIFPLAALCWLAVLNKEKWGKYLNYARIAAVLYLLQGLPYGKAAGMGTWANLSLWIGCVFLLKSRLDGDRTV